MTNSVHEQPAEYACKESTPTTSDPDTNIQLQYPQLYLEASLHSLLTHSFTSSSSASLETVTAMRPHEIPTEGSFIHIDENDVEEDNRSEITDASLTSGSNLDGLYAPTSDEEDADNDGEQENLIHISGRDGHTTEDSGDDSAAVIPSASSPITDREDFTRRPFCILSISHAASEETKDEALRKIGSVWIRPSLSSKSSSIHYHIVPSEFTMDWQSSSSDLIEISAQMVVFEGRLRQETASKSTSVHTRLELVNGTPVDFNEANKMKIRDSDGSWYTPDLVLILTSTKDNPSFHESIDHFIPNVSSHTTPLVVQQEEGQTSGYAVIDLVTLSNLDPESASLFIQEFLGEHADSSEVTRSRSAHSNIKDDLSDQENSFCDQTGEVKSGDTLREVDSLSSSPVKMTQSSSKFQSTIMTCQKYVDTYWLTLAIGILLLWVGCLVSSTFLATDSFGPGLLHDSQPRIPTAVTTSRMVSPSSDVAPLASVPTAPASLQSVSRAGPDIGKIVQQLLVTAKIAERLPENPSDTTEKPKTERKQSDLSAYYATCSEKDVIAVKGWDNTLTLPRRFSFSYDKPLSVVHEVRKDGRKIGCSMSRDLGRGGVNVVVSKDLNGPMEIVLGRIAGTEHHLCARIEPLDTVIDAVTSLLGKKQPFGYKILINLKSSDQDDDESLFPSSTAGPLRAAKQMVEKHMADQLPIHSSDVAKYITHHATSFRDTVLMTGQSASQRTKLAIDQTVSKIHTFGMRLAEFQPRPVHGGLNLPDMPWLESSSRIDKAQMSAKKLVNKVRGMGRTW